MKSSQFEHAIKMYSRAIDLDSSNAAAYNNRAQAFIALSEFEKAASDATACLSLEPQNTKALYRRGCCKLLIKPQDESAIKSAQIDFEVALSFNPPKDQKVALAKKLKECQKILQRTNKPTTTLDTKVESNKPKRRSHNSSALCF
jgi:serine/threonine-protein phosphatase 5